MLTASFEVLHDRFARLALGNVHLERLYTGCRWSEGPVYVPAGRYLLWSDIPNDRVMRWNESDGSVSVSWSGPGVATQTIPATAFTCDPFRAVPPVAGR